MQQCSHVVILGSVDQPFCPVRYRSVKDPAKQSIESNRLEAGERCAQDLLSQVR